MDKHYISAQQLLEDSFALAMAVFKAGFKPDCIIGVWRGGTPVGIAVQELLEVLGVKADHFAIRTSSYTGIGQRSRTVTVEGLDCLLSRLSRGQSILLVDDVYDTGLSLARVISDLEATDKSLDIQIATPYFKPANNQTTRSPDFYIHASNQWLVFPHELIGLSLEEIRQHKPELAPHLDALELSLSNAD